MSENRKVPIDLIRVAVRDVANDRLLGHEPLFRRWGDELLAYIDAALNELERLNDA